jgi:hypothetical protein
LRRSVPYTDCDGNARGKCNAYSYSDCDCNRFAYRDRDGNGNTNTYFDSKSYPDGQTSANSAPAPVGCNLNR